MTKQDEHELFLRIQEGDLVAKGLLYAQYEKLIKQYCRKYKHLDSLELQDLEQQCYFFFEDALRKFDISKDNKFMTFLYTQLMQLSRYVTYNDFTIRRPGDYFKDIKGNEAIKVSAVSIDVQLENGESFADKYEDDDARYWEEMENMDALKHDYDQTMRIAKLHLSQMPALGRTAVELVIFCGLPGVRVAEWLDMEQPTVAYHLKRFRGKMREWRERANIK